MAQIHCNFFAYSLGYGVDLTLLLPSMSSCDMGDELKRTHKILEKYPVLYLLHGHGNDYMSWNRFTSVERYAEERRIAIVTVSVGNKGYMNAAYGENYYDFVWKELPEFVKANFPISHRKEDTYIAGASMGGYGALAHALGHPESYQAVGAFSPGVNLGENAYEIVGHMMPEMKSLYKMLQKDVEERIELPQIFCCIGDHDFLIDSVDRFHQYMESLQVEHRYDRIDGYEHEWGFWDMEIQQFLDWLPRTDVYAKMGIHKL